MANLPSPDGYSIACELAKLCTYPTALSTVRNALGRPLFQLLLQLALSPMAQKTEVELAYSDFWFTR